MNSAPTWRYRLCLRLVSPVLIIHGIWRSWQDGGWQYAKERLGFVQYSDQASIHIHAASVGEVITVLPLIEKLQLLDPGLVFLITTNTPTGRALLAKHLSGNASHAYLPIDFAGATRRFFARQSITQLWIVETEIWPWLFARAKQRSIPISIINARLSYKSQSSIANFFTTTYARALSGVHVLARSSDDAQRYVDRGATNEHVCTIGNLKLSHTSAAQHAEPLVNGPYMLAASTHDDEELRLAQAWLESENSGLLVFAPRHVERGARLAKSLHALQQDMDPTLTPPAQRSLQQQPATDSRLYIADTLGELHDWYAHASAAFVGGSLIKRGGHNVLEPARSNTLIIVGPHTFNFAEEVHSLKAANAIAIAENAGEVIRFFALALSDPNWAQLLSDNAQDVIKKESAVLDAYIESLMH